MPQSLSQMLGFATSGWSPQGIGSPNLYPTIAPLFVAMYGFSRVLGLHIGLDVFVAVLYVVAAFGAFRLTLLVRPASHATAVVAAAAYVFSPVFADQLIAGHLADIVALAGLPWLIAGIAADDHPIAERLVSAVFGAALCLVQVQFVALVPAAVIILVAVIRTKRAAVVGLCSLVAGAVFAAPTLYQMMRVHGSAPLLDNERTVVGWELVQSASFHDAFVGQGYFAHYASTAALPAMFQPFVSGIYYAVPAALIIALVLSWRNKRVIVGLLLLYGVGFLTLSGLKGPAAPIWLFLFVHIKAASLMRELFHAAGFIALPVSVLCASALAASRGAFKNVVAALFILLLVSIDAPAIASMGQPWLMHPALSATTRKLVGRIADSDGAGRVFVYPGRQPVVARTGSSGVDPLEHYPLGPHFVFFNYFPSGIDALASDLVLNDRANAYAALFRRMSVGYILWRSEPRVNVDALAGTTNPLQLANSPALGIPKDAQLEHIPAYPIVYGSGLPLLVAGDYSRLLERSMSHDVLAFMRDAPPLARLSGAYRFDRNATVLDRLIAAGCGELVPVSPSVTDVDPHAGWVKSVRFGYADPALDYPLGGSVVTQVAQPKALPIPPGAEALFAVLNGSPNERFSWGHLPKTVKPGTALAVAGYFRHASGRCMGLQPANHASTPGLSVVAVNRTSVSHVTGIFRARGSSGTLVFTDAFDSAWQLRVDGARVAAVRHFKADGFANGWQISTTPGLHDYDIVYGVQAAFGILTSAEFGLWLLTIAGVVLLGGRALLSRGHD